MFNRRGDTLNLWVIADERIIGIRLVHAARVGAHKLLFERTQILFRLNKTQQHRFEPGGAGVIFFVWIGRRGDDSVHGFWWQDTGNVTSIGLVNNRFHTSRALKFSQILHHVPDSIQPERYDRGIGFCRANTNFGAEMEIADSVNQAGCQCQPLMIVKAGISALINFLQ